MPSTRAGDGKGLNPAYIKHGGKDSDGKRFKFQNFAQRVALVDIDVHHRLTADDLSEWRRPEVAGDSADPSQPFVLTMLQRWEELNITAPFIAFKREMEPLCLSVPLILHRRSHVFETVRRHLAAAPAISLKPMLETLAALAVDLRQEFYPEWASTLETLASMLRPTELEQLEDVFSTLCYLFKYLLKQLLADLPGAFNSFSPILAHEREHIRDFAAESFSYLLRRTSPGALGVALGAALWPHVGENSRLDNGISLLLFHAAKGLGQRFHSRTPELIEGKFSRIHSHAPFSPYVSTRSPHMSQPGLPICLNPVSTYVSTRSPHMSQPGLPICLNPVSPYVSTRSPHLSCTSFVFRSLC